MYATPIEDGVATLPVPNDPLAIKARRQMQMNEFLDMNEEQLRLALLKMTKELEAVRHSRSVWIVCLLIFAFFFGAWYSGQQARSSLKVGFERGYSSTAEGRAAIQDKALQDQAHLACDANGHNCINK